jgi:hypothetical protein
VVVDNKRGRRRGRGRSYSLQFSVIGLIAIAIFAVLSVTVLFRLNTVILHGASIYSTEEITAASGLRSGDNLIRKNMTECAAGITRELVYIEAAEVRRSFPSSVRITVAPCVETANIEHDGTWYLISATGKILEITDSSYNVNLLTFYGASPADGLLKGAKFESDDPRKTENVFELLEKTGTGVMAGKIKSVDVTDNYNVSCNYDDRITIVLGAVSEIDYKYKLADTIIRMNIGEDEEGTLTLRPEIASASFIDKYGLEFNESVYIDNLQKAAEEESEGTGVSPEDPPSPPVNFE